MTRSFRYCSRTYFQNWFTLFYMIKICCSTWAGTNICVKWMQHWSFTAVNVMSNGVLDNHQRGAADTIFSLSILDWTWEDVREGYLDLKELPTYSCITCFWILSFIHFNVRVPFVGLEIGVFAVCFYCLIWYPNFGGINKSCYLPTPWRNGRLVWETNIFLRVALYRN